MSLLNIFIWKNNHLKFIYKKAQKQNLKNFKKLYKTNTELL